MLEALDFGPPLDGLPYRFVRARGSRACEELEAKTAVPVMAPAPPPVPEVPLPPPPVLLSSSPEELEDHPVAHVQAELTAFGAAQLRTPVQLRHLVTNKLILESSNPDPRIRVKALELLGKISDVGLFADKTEISVTQRTTVEIKQVLLEKLDRLRAGLTIRHEDLGVVPDEEAVEE